MDSLRPAGKKYENNIAFIKDRLGHDFRYAINYTKIKKDLHYVPMIDFDQGLYNTVKWYVDNENWLLKKIS